MNKTQTPVQKKSPKIATAKAHGYEKPYITTPVAHLKTPPKHAIYEKSCGVVLFRIEKGERYYLLLHYPGGHWDFGKGHVELNENEIETALREMKEETGISKIILKKDFRYKVDYYYRRERKLYHKDVIFFIGKTSEEKIKISHEHQGFTWLPYGEAMKELTFDNAQKLLKKAENFLRKEDK